MAKKLSYNRIALIKAILFAFHFICAGPLFSVLNFFFDFRSLSFYNPIAYYACGLGGLYVLYAIACWILNRAVGVRNDMSLFVMPSAMVSQTIGILLFLISLSGSFGMSGSVFPVSGLWAPLVRAWSTLIDSFANSGSLFVPVELGHFTFPFSYFRYGEYPSTAFIAGYGIVFIHAALAVCFRILYLGKWKKLGLSRKPAFALKMYFALFYAGFVILEIFRFGTVSAYPWALVAYFLIATLESLILLLIYAMAFSSKIVCAILLILAFVFSVRFSMKSESRARRFVWIITHFVFGGPLFSIMSVFVDFSGAYAYNRFAFLVFGFGGLHLAFSLLSKLASHPNGGCLKGRLSDPVVIINALSSAVLFGLGVASDAGAKFFAIDFSRIGSAFSILGNPFVGPSGRVPFSTPLSVLNLSFDSLPAIGWLSLVLCMLCFTGLVAYAFNRFMSSNAGTVTYASIVGIALVILSFSLVGQAGWLVLAPFLAVFLLVFTLVQLSLYAVLWVIAGLYYCVKWVLIGIWTLIVLLLKGIWNLIVLLFKGIWWLLKWAFKIVIGLAIVGAVIGVLKALGDR